MIDTAYGKDAFDEVKKRVKEVKKEIDGNKKQFKDMEGQMNKSYQRMEGATNRYRDAHNMMETACDAFDRVSSSMDVTKNDVERAKGQMDVKTQACQNAKSEYASQMQTTNKEQKDHYTVHLPELISRMQGIYKENSDFIVNELKTCISKEQERNPIIAKCHESMIAALGKVNVEQDCQLVVERHKTGGLPPDEMEYTELQRGESGNKLGLRTNRLRTVSTQSIGPSPFQQMRALDKRIQDQEQAIKTLRKEQAGVKAMVDTYKSNPSFADAKTKAKVNEEYETVAQKVNQAEGILSGFVKEREDIMQQMQPSVRPKPSVRRPKQKAVKEQSPTQDNAAGGGPPPPPPPGGSGGGGGPPPPPPPPHGGGGGHAGPVPTPERESSETLPPPPIMTSGSVDEFDYYESQDYPEAQASYDYDSQGAEDILSMTEGEKFNVLEGDNEGWTLVQRLTNGEEGFVPSSFLVIS